MSIIENRNSKDSIEQRFIEKSLRDQAAGILKDSRRAMRGFSQSRWRNVKMDVDKTTLTYEHLAVHRFVDMKTRKAKNYSAATKTKKAGRERKKKNYPVHNKVIFSHKRFLIKQLSFGFTDEVKAQFSKLKEFED